VTVEEFASSLEEIGFEDEDVDEAGEDEPD
jgi:hypothetical protein